MDDISQFKCLQLAKTTDKQIQYIEKLSINAGVPLSNIKLNELNRRQATDLIDWLENERRSPYTLYYTYKLYLAGMTFQQIEEFRSLKHDTIMLHFLKIMQLGLPVEFSDFVSKEDEQLVLQILQKNGSQKLKILKDLLPERITYYQIKFTMVKNGYWAF